MSSHILIHHLDYLVSEDKFLFQNLSLHFFAEKTGIVGRNGMGKTTLIKLITGELKPHEGQIEVAGRLAYCPQIAPTQEDLSGGEQTQKLLNAAFSEFPNFLILDEPTNHLDTRARAQLYARIQRWQGGLLVVSHDRTLLNLMDQIVELTSLGAQLYGGNYDDYLSQKKQLDAAHAQEMLDAKKQIKNTHRAMQNRKEISDRKKSYGRKKVLKGGLTAMTADARIERAERTQKRVAKLDQSRLKQALSDHQLIREKIEICESMHIELPKTCVPQGKKVVEIENLSFSYPGENKLLIENFNLDITGPERIALEGSNGSGKTTLVKLLLGELKAQAGRIHIGVNSVQYLDQKVSFLNPTYTVLEQFQALNPEVLERDARFGLAQFLFRHQDALKKCEQLSGGERLRAGLACVLLSQKPPQLLILDEPANHLDIESLEHIASALESYKGALILISHDHAFLEQVGIERVISAPFKCLP